MSCNRFFSLENYIHGAFLLVLAISMPKAVVILALSWKNNCGQTGNKDEKLPYSVRVRIYIENWPAISDCTSVADKMRKIKIMRFFRRFLFISLTSSVILFYSHRWWRRQMKIQLGKLFVFFFTWKCWFVLWSIIINRTKKIMNSNII